MESSWRRARTLRTVAAYEEFVERYPDSESVRVARSEIEALRFEEVKQRNEIAGYEEFLSDYPTSRFVQDVRERLDVAKAALKSQRTRKEFGTVTYLGVPGTQRGCAGGSLAYPAGVDPA
jgi:outer membrane protein assembly factor BamD (BamD/ComL family)